MNVQGSGIVFVELQIDIDQIAHRDVTLRSKIKLNLLSGFRCFDICYRGTISLNYYMPLCCFHLFTNLKSKHLTEQVTEVTFSKQELIKKQLFDVIILELFYQPTLMHNFLY